MIYTITLNPAIDHTTYLLPNAPQQDIRPKSDLRQAAGKGINVSFALQTLHIPSTVVTILGGDNGRFIEETLIERDIPHLIHRIKDNTRENLKIVSPSGAVEERNQAGAPVSKSDIEHLMNRLLEVLIPGDLVVLTGSLPPGIDPNTYQWMLEQLHHKDVITLLDASGEALRLGIEAKPHIIKPNQDELSQYVNKSITNIDDAIKAAHTIVEKGVATVLVTLGSKGALLVDDETVLYAPPMPIKVQNTVGAGDSFVAGYIAHYESKTPTERFRYASAFANCSVQSDVTGIVNTSTLNEMYDKTILQQR